MGHRRDTYPYKRAESMTYERASSLTRINRGPNIDRN